MAIIPALDFTGAQLHGALVDLNDERITPDERTKLTGIAVGATRNAADAQLRDRATHTGTQPISTIVSLQAVLDAVTARLQALEANASNRAPTASAIPAQSLTVGTAYAFNPFPAWSDPDNDTLTFTMVDGTLPPGVTFSPTTGFSATKPTTAGSYNVVIRGTDPDGLWFERGVAFTVSAPAPGGPGIAATLDAQIQIVSTTGISTTFAILPPSIGAGTYTVQHADLAAGPVWLARPVLSLTTDALPRAIVTVTPGVYVYDPDLGEVTVTQGMHNTGTLLAGTSGLTYVITETDRGDPLAYRQTATQPGGKSRTAISDVLPVLTTGILADTFTAPDGTMLSAYVGESGQAWDNASVRIIQGGYLIGIAATFFAKRLDDVSSGKYTVIARMRSALNTGLAGYYDRGAWPAVGISADASAGFWLRNALNDNTIAIYRKVGGVESRLKVKGPCIPVNTDYEVRMVVDGATCTVWVNGVVIPELGFSDPALAGGGPGVAGWGGSADHNKIDMFKVETTR